MMFIRYILLSFCISLSSLLFFSCSHSNNQQIVPQITDISELTSVKFPSDFEFISLDKDGNSIVLSGEWKLDEYGNYIDQQNSAYYLFNCYDNNFRHLFTLKDVMAGSGEYLLKNGFLYNSACISNKSSQFNYMYCLDTDTGLCSEINITSSTLPFQFLSWLNDDEIIIFEPDKDSSKNSTFTYSISKYNIKSQTLTELVHETYDKENSLGTVISCVYAYENTIYAIVQDPTIEARYCLRHYSDKGAILATLPFSDIENKLYDKYGNDSIWKIRVIDTHLIITTLNRKILLYRMYNNDLLYIDSSQLTWFDYIESCDTSSPDFLLFHKFASNQLILFFPQNDFFCSLALPLNAPYNVISNIVRNKNGDILYKACTPDYSDFKVYKASIQLPQ